MEGRLAADNLSCREIGIRIGVSWFTVSREVRRNGATGGYSAAEAHGLSDTRRRTATKRFISPDTVFYVETGLSWKWSPEQISSIDKRIGTPVSHEWSYQHVQADKAAGGALTSISERVNAVTVRDTGRSAVPYRERSPLSCDRPWLTSVAVWRI